MVIATPSNQKVRLRPTGLILAGNVQISFSLKALQVAKYKVKKCPSSVTNILMVLGAVVQCLETVIASSNPCRLVH